VNQILLDVDPLPKKTRKEIFLQEMDEVVPWGLLVGPISPHAAGAQKADGGAGIGAPERGEKRRKGAGLARQGRRRRRCN
jgi:IS5 family transposase